MSTLGRAFSVAMSGLILINVVFVLVDTVPRLPEAVQVCSSAVEIISVAIFTADYAMRLWTAPLAFPGTGPVASRLRYAVSGMAIIDLASILPFYLPMIIPVDLRILRLLRLARLAWVFRLGRHSSALATVGRVLRKSAPALASSIFVIGLLIVISAVIEYHVESAANPDAFESAFSALWWAVTTITTVGYGDVFPVTGVGKVIASAIALLGVALVAIPTGIISAGFMSEIGRKSSD
jgi:voltage-gated potassium channel